MSVVFGIWLTAPDRKSRVASLKKKNVPVISVIDDLIFIYTVSSNTELPINLLSICYVSNPEPEIFISKKLKRWFPISRRLEFETRAT